MRDDDMDMEGLTHMEETAAKRETDGTLADRVRWAARCLDIDVAGREPEELLALIVATAGYTAERTRADIADRLLPDGIVWPRYEDGRPVMPGDAIRDEGRDNVVAIVMFNYWSAAAGYATIVPTTAAITDYCLPFSYKLTSPDERVERSPKTSLEVAEKDVNTACSRVQLSWGYPHWNKEKQKDLQKDLVRASKNLIWVKNTPSRIAEMKESVRAKQERAAQEKGAPGAARNRE